ncbi:MAG: cellulase family glycosylhydrolase [Anaerolineae bacterium]
MRRVYLFVGIPILLLLMGLGFQQISWGQGGLPDWWPPASPFGVDMRGTIDESQGLSYAVAAGTRWVRIKLSWEDVEPVRSDPPQYNWSFYDAIFRRASEAGLQLVVTFRDNPSWAAATRCGPLYDPNDLARFARAAVERYSRPPYNIKVWELYNEPDNMRTDGWFINLGGCWGNAGRAYADMLKVVYPVIRQADPESVVLIGALGYEFRYVDHLNMNFLGDVLRAGGGPYFDVMNFHYFHEYHTNWDNSTTQRFDLQGKLDSLKAVLTSQGVQPKPFVITELGHPYAGPPAEGYTPKGNSRYVIQGNVRAVAEGIGIIIWYQMVDGPEDVRLYGLLDADREPQAGYEVYRFLLDKLNGATYNGPYQKSTYGLEAYQFHNGDGDLFIGWCRHDGIVPMTVAWTQALVWSRQCGDTTCGPYEAVVITDGDSGDRDGKRDGKITLWLTSDPVFVEGVSTTPTPTPTNTWVPTATVTLFPSPTATSTSTATMVATATPSPTPTATAVPSATPTATSSATPDPDPSPTGTPAASGHVWLPLIWTQ